MPFRGRDSIGEAVTDVLVRRGDPEVVRNVADNKSAKLSDHGFTALVKRAEEDGVLAEKVGRPLPHLAIGWALEHPAVTSVIVGCRNVAQLDGVLAGASVRLDEETLDRIDEIVRPGWTINPANRSWVPPSLADSSLRRR